MTANNWDSGHTAFPIDISPHVRSRFYGLYLNDDWKVTRNLTLSLGLRYEYESPFHDAQNRETRALDLNAPIPELQGTQMPAELGQFYQGPWNMTGAFQFASDQHPGSWDGGAGSVSPRIGIAYRLNDKTVMRAAYGRYVTPWTTNSSHDQLSGFSLYGYSNFTGAPNDIQGVPQMRLDDPFPASNPVAPSREKSLGIYTMLGNSLTYFDPESAPQQQRPLQLLRATGTAGRHGAGCHLLLQPHRPGLRDRLQHQPGRSADRLHVQGSDVWR